MFSLLLLVAAFSGCSPHRGATRELVLIARGMSFVLEDQPGVINPTIALRTGQRVHLVLRNEAPGLLHDVSIPAFDIDVEPARAGESREVTFIVPDVPGRHEYHCRPHSQWMKGVIDVTR